MQIDYPFGFDAEGRTAQPSDDDKHVRDLIEQVLFTSPGERVNRPTFGTGLAQLLFAPSSAEVATATQFMVQAALQSSLGDLIVVQDVTVEGTEGALNVNVKYVVLRTQQRLVAQFKRGGV
jgi:phage baseplate assembly protein W